ncbi:MAG: FlgD immunoglobulin-like domain containing protein [Candidatus Delongbacteria bacterium]
MNMRLLLLLALGLGSGWPGRALGGCQLANPSFEIFSAAGQPFGGWTAFGPVDSSARAVHGQLAARIRGAGGGSLAGLWQDLDAAPGQRWDVTGHVAHSATERLTGACLARVSVEWRGANGGLLDSASVAVADSASALDVDLGFHLLSPPAPAGTTTARLVLGLWQDPAEPAPAVRFDQLTFRDARLPGLDELQWADFPGGRRVEFAGRSWRVKGPGWYGPGPNHFSDSPECVRVDDQGRLHLGIRLLDAAWRSSEVALEDSLGYGDYVFTTVGALDQLDLRAVFGLFLWEYGPCTDGASLWWNPYNEFDIEFSRWGNPANGIGQFVAQPWDWAGNLDRFDAAFGAEESASHAFRWLPDRVECRSWRGGPGAEAPETLLHQWTYTGPHIPRPEQPRVHLNLWQAGGLPATEQEVILAAFTFTPAEGSTDLPAPQAPPASQHRAAPIRLHPPVPNPGNPAAALRFSLDLAGEVELAIFDLRGARVRTLVRGARPAGEHVARWDGRNEAGVVVAGGLYFCRLSQGPWLEVQRLLLLP